MLLTCGATDSLLCTPVCVKGGNSHQNKFVVINFLGFNLFFKMDNSKYSQCERKCIMADFEFTGHYSISKNIKSNSKWT